VAQTEELKTERRKPSKQNTKLFDFGRSLFSFAPRFKREKLPLLAARGFREERAMLLEKVRPLQHFRVTPNRWTKMPRHIMISTIFEKNRASETSQAN